MTHLLKKGPIIFVAMFTNLNGNVGTSSPHRTNQYMQKDHKSQKNHQDWSFRRVRLATKMIGPILLNASLSTL